MKILFLGYNPEDFCGFNKITWEFLTQLGLDKKNEIICYAQGIQNDKFFNNIHLIAYNDDNFVKTFNDIINSFDIIFVLGHLTDWLPIFPVLQINDGNVKPKIIGWHWLPKIENNFLFPFYFLKYYDYLFLDGEIEENKIFLKDIDYINMPFGYSERNFSNIGYKDILKKHSNNEDLIQFLTILDNSEKYDFFSLIEAIDLLDIKNIKNIKFIILWRNYNIYNSRIIKPIIHNKGFEKLFILPKENNKNINGVTYEDLNYLYNTSNAFIDLKLDDSYNFALNEAIACGQNNIFIPEFSLSRINSDGCRLKIVDVDDLAMFISNVLNNFDTKIEKENDNIEKNIYKAGEQVNNIINNIKENFINFRKKNKECSLVL